MCVSIFAQVCMLVISQSYLVKKTSNLIENSRKYWFEFLVGEFRYETMSSEKWNTHKFKSQGRVKLALRGFSK